jgi:calcineurin-like phosphoesterase family protein
MTDRDRQLLEVELEKNAKVEACRLAEKHHKSNCDGNDRCKSCGFKLGFRPRVNYSRETIDRMNSAIIDNINAVVGVDDTIWNLGDVMFGGRDPVQFYNRLRGFRDRIACRNINLIWGNHDQQLQWWNGPRRAITKEQFHTIFNDAYDQKMINVNGQRIMLNHYAMAVWNGSHKGNWHLYGHSHGNFEPWRQEHLPQARMIDVGIDNSSKLGFDYAPFSLEDLQKIMDKKAGQLVDHHETKARI